MTAIKTPTKEELTSLRQKYDGFCMDAADELLHRYGGVLLYVECPGQKTFSIPISGDDYWCYHAAVLIDRRVYDPWTDGAFTLKNYLAEVFGTMVVTVTMDTVDVYTGPAHQFRRTQKETT